MLSLQIQESGSNDSIQLFQQVHVTNVLERQTGFSIIAAIFLLVVLALLGAFIVSVTGMQHRAASSTCWACGRTRARAPGWNGRMAGPRSRQHVERRGAQYLSDGRDADLPCVSPKSTRARRILIGITVTVTCAQTANTTEGNRNVRVFQIVATACNQGASCPAATPTNGYVERQVQASLAKCISLPALARSIRAVNVRPRTKFCGASTARPHRGHAE